MKSVSDENRRFSTGQFFAFFICLPDQKMFGFHFGVKLKLLTKAVLLLGVAALCTLMQAMLRRRDEPPRVAVGLASATIGACLEPALRSSGHSVGPPSGCLQQAMWGKCDESYMGGCDVSCGRCASLERARALASTLLVSARQPQPCAVEGGEGEVAKVMENHAEYARAHGMKATWTSKIVEPGYEGAWNKVAWLRAQMQAALLRQSSLDGARRRPGWLLWVDWDVVFLNLGAELPLEEYEARGIRLVVGGDPAGVAQADYRKLNTGVMLLRVDRWSLALLDELLHHGRQPGRRRRALAAQKVLKNLCDGCLDDQAALLLLLHQNASQWSSPTHLERRFLLQVLTPPLAL